MFNTMSKHLDYIFFQILIYEVFFRFFSFFLLPFFIFVLGVALIELAYESGGEGDSYDLYYLKVYVPKYQIKLLQNQKWKSGGGS